MVDAIEAVERRRRLIRGILLAIIIGTLPFYCIGFVLWGTAPDPTRRDPTATITPIGGDITPSATYTATDLVTTTLQATVPLFPSPTQGFPIQPTRYLSPTPPPIPTSTDAPTLTAVPTETHTTPPTLTETPLPLPTDTPPPTDEPPLLPPTNTEPAQLSTQEPIVEPPIDDPTVEAT